MKITASFFVWLTKRTVLILGGEGLEEEEGGFCFADFRSQHICGKSRQATEALARGQAWK